MNTASGFWTRSVLGVLAVVAVAVVLLRQSAIARLRDEAATLAATSVEAVRLAKENEQLRGQSSGSEEVAKLREANKDLPRLRNEARQLRRKLDELNTLKAENTRLLARQAEVAAGGGVKVRPPGFVLRSQLFDAGLATPEAAVKTALWAWSQGNIDRMAQCMTPDQAAKFLKELETNREDITKLGASIPGYLITETNTVSADEVTFKVMLLQDDEGHPEMRVKRIGNEWRIAN